MLRIDMAVSPSVPRIRPSTRWSLTGPQEAPRRRRDRLGGDPEFLVDRLVGGAGAETVDPHDGPLQADVMLPAQADPRLDGHPRPDGGGEDRIPVFLRLAVEELPARERNDADPDPLRGERPARREGDLPPPIPSR